MKRLLLLCLLLSLALGGCSLLKAPEPAEPTSPSLPTLMPADTTPLPTQQQTSHVYPVPPRGLEQEVPVIEDSVFGSPMLVGPNGSVAPDSSYGGITILDPLYADVDRDGRMELVFRHFEQISGLSTQRICIYGMEQGWPVLEAASRYHMQEPYHSAWMYTDGEAVFFCLSREASFGSSDADSSVRLPLAVRDGSIELNGSKLPVGLDRVMDSPLEYGVSLSALRERCQTKQVILNEENCLIWQESITVNGYSSYMQEDGSSQDGIFTLQYTYAAISENGVTVTGCLTYQSQGLGFSIFCDHKGLEPIAAPSFPLSDLVGCSRQELFQKLGSCHAALGEHGSLLLWFTTDGQLLTVRLSDRAEEAELQDLIGEAPTTQLSGDAVPVVTVNCNAVSGKIDGRELWDGFLEKTAQGKPDEVRLRLIYDDAEFTQTLQFDGTFYTLTEDGRSTAFRYLIAEPEAVEAAENAAPTDHAAHIVHYFLSDDSDMTYARLLLSMVSSTILPDFPNSAYLFSCSDE